MGENNRREDDRVGALYRDYQDWRARVYGALDRLSAAELSTLGRLLQGDTRLLQGDTRLLLDRIEAARERVRGTHDDGAR